MRLSDFPVMGKVFVIVALMGVGAAGIGGLGMYTATELRGAVVKVDRAILDHAMRPPRLTHGDRT